VELLHVSRQLGAFVQAGVPILESLASIVAALPAGRLRTALEGVTEDLRRGRRLSDALDAHPKVFPAFYVTAIQAAEQTGSLDRTLRRLADYLERELELRQRLQSALTYPVIVLVLAAAVMVLLATTVLPRFERLFESFGSDLPLATRVLVGSAAFVRSWGLVLVAAGLAMVGLLLVLRRTPGGARAWDAMVLRLPVSGALVRTALVERFCRALGSMTAAAVPLDEALRVAADGTDNHVFRTRMALARQGLLQGEGLAVPIARTGLLPAAAVQMIRAGEHTGSLDRQLEVAADYYEQDLEYRLKRFTALFEPAVLLVAGAVVGFVAIALVSAMYGMLNGMPG
jgi:type IV pilus assembly protein PilC